MSKPAQDQIRYEVITQEDEVTGDLLLPIPPQLLAQLGWSEGDEIEFSIDEGGKYILKKTNK
jgi:bifunctional DNA-binding transcriptional regulator/antitoxin component of YhaV-PrlF toxin-antitoxin module